MQVCLYVKSFNLITIYTYIEHMKAKKDKNTTKSALMIQAQDTLYFGRPLSFEFIILEYIFFLNYEIISVLFVSFYFLFKKLQ